MKRAALGDVTNKTVKQKGPKNVLVAKKVRVQQKVWSLFGLSVHKFCIFHSYMCCLMNIIESLIDRCCLCIVWYIPYQSFS